MKPRQSFHPLRRYNSYASFFVLLACFPWGGCTSPPPEIAEMVANSSTATKSPPQNLTDYQNGNELQKRLCEAVHKGLTIISDYDRTLVSPDAEHVPEDVAETIRTLIDSRKIVSFNVVTMRGFGSPVINEIAKFPVYLYAEGGLLFLPPSNVVANLEMNKNFSWFAPWIEENKEILRRETTDLTELKRWHIRFPNKEIFDRYRAQRETPCGLMEQTVRQAEKKKVANQGNSVQPFVYSNNVLGCTLLHSDKLSEKTKKYVDDKLAEITRKIEIFIKESRRDGHKILYKFQKIHDGIALDVETPNKGTAAREILVGDGIINEDPQECSKPSGMVLTLGDDINDQQMFDEVHALGNRGISVIVGTKTEWGPNTPVQADYRVANKEAAHKLLQAIVRCGGFAPAPADPIKRVQGPQPNAAK